MLTLDATAVIREAIPEDLPALERLFETFRQSSVYARYIAKNPDVSSAFLLSLIHGVDTTIIVREVAGDVIGMLGLMAFHHPMSGERIASELFWWLDPAHRGAGGWLLKRGEKWAVGKGAVRIQMASPSDNDRVIETYGMMGYVEYERLYFKELTT